jgi:transcriptional regulator with XRE-family HTH domain
MISCKTPSARPRCRKPQAKPGDLNTQALQARRGDFLDDAFEAAHTIIMTKKVNTIAEPAIDPYSGEAMALAVAQRISSLRRTQNLTFDALALRSGVSKGTLVQIEHERANPSISTLCRLAAALGVSVADLVSPPDEVQSMVSVAGANDARTLWTGPRGGSAVFLAGTTGADMLEIWQWELKPGERYEATRHGRGTRELIHVTSGRLLLDVEGQTTVVAAGATAIAQTDRQHAYTNSGKSSVRFFMTVHEPLSAP